MQTCHAGVALVFIIKWINEQETEATVFAIAAVAKC